MERCGMWYNGGDLGLGCGVRGVTLDLDVV